MVDSVYLVSLSDPCWKYHSWNATQEVRVECTPLRIVLREDSEVLEGVVVTAFGTGQRKLPW